MDRTLHVTSHGLGAFVSILAPKLETPIDDTGEGLAHVRHHASNARSWQARHLSNEFHRVDAFMDAASGPNAKPGGGEREQIGAAVNFIKTTCSLLGRHERWSAEREPVGGNRLPLLEPREPEIEHLDARAGGNRPIVLNEEKVLGLQIAVDHTPSVRGLQNVEHAVCELQKFSLPDGRPAFEAVLKRLAIQ